MKGNPSAPLVMARPRTKRTGPRFKVGGCDRNLIHTDVVQNCCSIVRDEKSRLSSHMFPPTPYPLCQRDPADSPPKEQKRGVRECCVCCNLPVPMLHGQLDSDVPIAPRTAAPRTAVSESYMCPAAKASHIPPSLSLSLLPSLLLSSTPFPLHLPPSPPRTNDRYSDPHPRASGRH